MTKTTVILGTGPSLTAEDVASCRGKAEIIAVNGAWQLAPFADVLYACDHQWWRNHPQTKAFSGMKFSLGTMPGRPDVFGLRDGGRSGLALEPNTVRTGDNSGYQAINLAAHLGAKRIVLLGFDLQRRKGTTGLVHFFGNNYPWQTGERHPDFASWKMYFGTLVKPLQALGIDIVNCSRQTALTCFRQARLEEVLV